MPSIMYNEEAFIASKAYFKICLLKGIVRPKMSKKSIYSPSFRMGSDMDR